MRTEGGAPSAETQHPRVNEYLFLGYDAPLWRPPGAEMSYCNYGYELLGEIVRHVGGRSLADVAQERIFEPLDMKDTCYVVPDSMRHRVVRRPSDALLAGPDWPGYDGLPSVIRSLYVGFDTPEWQETPWPSGAAYSTAMDMATFGQMFLDRGTYGGGQDTQSGDGGRDDARSDTGHQRAL